MTIFRRPRRSRAPLRCCSRRSPPAWTTTSRVRPVRTPWRRSGSRLPRVASARGRHWCPRRPVVDTVAVGRAQRLGVIAMRSGARVRMSRALAALPGRIGAAPSPAEQVGPRVAASRSLLVPSIVAIDRIAAMLAARRAELATESLREIRAAIPVYGEIDDPALLADVTEHVAENHDALRSSLVRGQPVTTQDLRVHRAARRAARAPRSAAGKFLQAFRIGHRVIWDAIVKLADEDLEAESRGTRRRTTHHGVHRPREHARGPGVPRSAAAAPGRGGNRVRRDLLEDLLRRPRAGTRPAPQCSPRRGAGLWRPVGFPDRGRAGFPARRRARAPVRGFGACARHRRRPPSPDRRPPGRDRDRPGA